MDGVSSQHLYARLGRGAAPVLVDGRRAEAFGADQPVIIDAIHRLPEAVSDCRADLPKNRDVVVYCVHGREVSHGVAKVLQNAGIKAAYLEGGIGGWKELRLPTRRKRDASENKWVTREHPKIDRIACPWLISRFIKPDAEFIYVPPNEVASIAASVGGTPYDIKGVEFGHVGERC